jgi:hypothetical protein
MATQQVQQGACAFALVARRVFSQRLSSPSGPYISIATTQKVLQYLILPLCICFESYFFAYLLASYNPLCRPRALEVANLFRVGVYRTSCEVQRSPTGPKARIASYL